MKDSWFNFWELMAPMKEHYVIGCDISLGVPAHYFSCSLSWHEMNRPPADPLTKMNWLKAPQPSEQDLTPVSA